MEGWTRMLMSQRLTLLHQNRKSSHEHIQVPEALQNLSVDKALWWILLKHPSERSLWLVPPSFLRAEPPHPLPLHIYPTEKIWGLVGMCNPWVREEGVCREESRKSLDESSPALLFRHSGNKHIESNWSGHAWPLADNVSIFFVKTRNLIN